MQSPPPTTSPQPDCQPYPLPPPELRDPQKVPQFLTSKSNDKAARWAVGEARRSSAAFTALFRGPLSPFHLQLQQHFLTHSEAGAEVPRGHGKTTGLGFTACWLAGNDIDLRFKCVGSVLDEAEKTTVMCREVISSPLYQLIFPHARIQVGDNAKGAFRFANRKTIGMRDPTFEARAIMGQTGGRFDVLWGDDLCTLANTILKPAERAKVKAAWEGTWLPMCDYGAGENEKKRLWTSWTPWHVDDVSVGWAKHHAALGTLFRRACAMVDGRWVSPWPERWTHEILAKERIKQGDIGFSRAYLLQRISNDMLVFKHEWMLNRLYHGRCGDGVTVKVASLDFAYTKQGTMKEDRDYSVCLIAEVDRWGNAYLTDLLRVRTDYPTFKAMAIERMRVHGVLHAYAEANGPQKGIVDQFQLESPIPVIPLDRLENPIVRAAQAQPFVAAGKLRLPAHPSEPTQVRGDFQELFDEMVAFPVGAHDDMVSCVCDIAAATVRGLAMPGGGPAQIVTLERAPIMGSIDPDADAWEGFGRMAQG